jgi:hypothetical protein
MERYHQLVPVVMFAAQSICRWENSTGRVAKYTRPYPKMRRGPKRFSYYVDLG